MAHTVKNLPAMLETQFNPWVMKIPWRRQWQPTLVFLPGKLCGQRSPVGYSPWGHKESDTTEQLTLSHFLSRPAIFDYLFYLNVRFLYTHSSFSLGNFSEVMGAFFPLIFSKEIIL